MDDLRGELRRLGLGGSRANGQMLKAERESYDHPRAVPIVRVIVDTFTTNQEDSLHDSLALIATAFRKKLITEEQAKLLVRRLGR